MAKETKFSKLITATGAEQLAKRSSGIQTGLNSAAQKCVQALEDRLNEIDLKIIGLEDLGVDSTISTKPANIDTTSWWAERYQLELEKTQLKIELRIAQELKAEYLDPITEEK